MNLIDLGKSGRLINLVVDVLQLVVCLTHNRSAMSLNPNEKLMVFFFV